MSTVAIVPEYPRCDLHWQREQHSVDAQYDARTIFGSWANMCGDCFATYGVGLGTGRGQRLILEKDV